MTATSRRKGTDGERELARLLSDELGPVARNLVQTREGGHDLEGLGLTRWALEVKRYSKATPARVSTWWLQAVAQAARARRAPALAYRQDRADWCVVVPLAELRGDLGDGEGLEWTATLSLPAFCALVREGLT